MIPLLPQSSQTLTEQFPPVGGSNRIFFIMMTYVSSGNEGEICPRWGSSEIGEGAYAVFWNAEKFDHLLGAGYRQ